MEWRARWGKEAPFGSPCRATVFWLRSKGRRISHACLVEQIIRCRVIWILTLWSVRLGIVLLFATATGLSAQDRGRISGRVTGSIGTGMPGVVVAVNELGAMAVTSKDGRYEFDRVPPGTYELIYTLGGNVETEIGIEVAVGTPGLWSRKVYRRLYRKRGRTGLKIL